MRPMWNRTGELPPLDAYAIGCYTELAMNLIDALRQYRLDHQLTQEELAEQLGVAFTTVNRWFNDKTHPGELQEHRIKKLLGQTRKRP